MSEAKMKMEDEVFREIMHEWMCDVKDDYDALASRLGIELTREEEVSLRMSGDEVGISIESDRGPVALVTPIFPLDRAGVERLLRPYFDRHQPPPPKIPTREELGEAIRNTFIDTCNTHRHDSVIRWTLIADAVFRAFGLEPRKEEDHGA